MSRTKRIFGYCDIRILGYLIVAVSLFFCFDASNVFATGYMQPQVKVYSKMGNKLDTTFLAFDKNFKGGAYPAIGDVNNDGKDEIIAGAGFGGGPQIRVFEKDGKSTGINFFAYDKSYTNGVDTAICNLDNKGRNEIVTGKVMKDKSEVRVFRINKKNKVKLLSSFVAYGNNFKGGVNVACGDVNNDSKDEIVTGAGPTGSASVKVFSFNANKNRVFDTGFSLKAFGNDFRGGANVSVGNLNGNPDNMNVVVSQATKGNKVAIYKINKNNNKLSAKLIRTLTAYKNFTGGVNVAVGSLDNSGKDRIVTAPAESGGPNVEIFNLKGKLLKNINVYANDFRGGVRLAVTKRNSISEKKLIFVVAPGFQQASKCEKDCVALTFDDGYNSPNGSFDSILNTLKAKKAPATFFMLGVVMKGYPDRMRQIVADGFQLANHSYSHGDFTRMSSSQIISEIIYTDSLAKSITGKQTKPYFRYPGGSHNASTDAIVKNLGYHYFGWTASAGDTGSNVTVQSVTWGMLWNLHDGSIILGHTMKDQTAAALPTVIDAIRRAGFHLATLEQMSSYWGT